VIFPLELVFSMDQVASALGISRSWTCQLRMDFIRTGGLQAATKPKHGGRGREHMSKEEESTFLAPFLDKAVHGGILIVSVDERMGSKTALAST